MSDSCHVNRANASRRSLFCAAAALAILPREWAQAATPGAAPRDGSRDFDGHIGTWKTRVRRLQRPLTGAGTWVEYEGTTVVRALIGGRANVAELSIAGPAGRIEGAALRLYQPDTGRWTIHYFSAVDGRLTPPLEGRFGDARAEFRGADTLGTRPIEVRFVIEPDGEGWRFEQAFSADAGKTWEVNWIAIDQLKSR
jgi:hypothetical protein